MTRATDFLAELASRAEEAGAAEAAFRTEAEARAAALAHARAEGRRVVPECSYVAAYFGKHPEHASLLARP